MSYYPRATIQAALDIVTPLLRDHCEILTPAGSFRRGLPQSRDLDLVAVPKHVQQQGDMFGGGEPASRSPLTDRLVELRDTGRITFDAPPGSDDTGKHGDRMARFWLTDGMVWDKLPKQPERSYPESRLPIDLYIVLPPATYAVILAIRTGSVAWNKAMMAWLKSTNDPAWRFHDGALWYEGQAVSKGPATISEKAQLYDLIGLPYIDPEYRGTMQDFQKVRP